MSSGHEEVVRLSSSAGDFLRAASSASRRIGSSAGGRKPVQQVWSKFLGCMTPVYRKEPKHDLDIFLREIMVWMCHEKKMHTRNQRNLRMNVLFQLLLQEGDFDVSMPIEKSIRVPIVEERRTFLFASNSTAFMRGERKKLINKINELNRRIEEINGAMHNMQMQEEKRKAEAAWRRAEARMLEAMTSGIDEGEPGSPGGQQSSHGSEDVNVDSELLDCTIPVKLRN